MDPALLALDAISQNHPEKPNMQYTCQTCNALVHCKFQMPANETLWSCMLRTFSSKPQRRYEAAVQHSGSHVLCQHNALHACRPGTPAWQRSGRPLRRARQGVLLSSKQRERLRSQRSRPWQSGWQLRLLRVHRNQNMSSQRVSRQLDVSMLGNIHFTCHGLGALLNSYPEPKETWPVQLLPWRRDVFVKRTPYTSELHKCHTDFGGTHAYSFV